MNEERSVPRQQAPGRPLTQVKPAPPERTAPQKEPSQAPVSETGAAVPAPELPADPAVKDTVPGQLKRPG